MLTTIATLLLSASLADCACSGPDYASWAFYAPMGLVLAPEVWGYPEVSLPYVQPPNPYYWQGVPASPCEGGCPVPTPGDAVFWRAYKQSKLSCQDEGSMSYQTGKAPPQGTPSGAQCSPKVVQTWVMPIGAVLTDTQREYQLMSPGTCDAWCSGPGRDSAADPQTALSEPVYRVNPEHQVSPLPLSDAAFSLHHSIDGSDCPSGFAGTTQCANANWCVEQESGTWYGESTFNDGSVVTDCGVLAHHGQCGVVKYCSAGDTFWEINSYPGQKRWWNPNPLSRDPSWVQVVADDCRQGLNCMNKRTTCGWFVKKTVGRGISEALLGRMAHPLKSDKKSTTVVLPPTTTGAPVETTELTSATPAGTSTTAGTPAGTTTGASGASTTVINTGTETALTPATTGTAGPASSSTTLETESQTTEATEFSSTSAAVATTTVGESTTEPVVDESTTTVWALTDATSTSVEVTSLASTASSTVVSTGTTEAATTEASSTVVTSNTSEAATTEAPTTTPVPATPAPVEATGLQGAPAAEWVGTDGTWGAYRTNLTSGCLTPKQVYLLGKRVGVVRTAWAASTAGFGQSHPSMGPLCRAITGSVYGTSCPDVSPTLVSAGNPLWTAQVWDHRVSWVSRSIFNTTGSISVLGMACE